MKKYTIIFAIIFILLTFSIIIYKIKISNSVPKSSPNAPSLLIRLISDHGNANSTYSNLSKLILEITMDGDSNTKYEKVTIDELNWRLFSHTGNTRIILSRVNNNSNKSNNDIKIFSINHDIEIGKDVCVINFGIVESDRKINQNIDNYINKMRMNMKQNDSLSEHNMKIFKSFLKDHYYESIPGDYELQIVYQPKNIHYWSGVSVSKPISFKISDDGRYLENNDLQNLLKNSLRN